MPSAPTPSIFDQRRDQMVPKLDSLQIERVRRFGEVRSFADGERIMTVGEVAENVGYGSESTFSVAFTRHVGLPPKHYARKHAESPNA